MSQLQLNVSITTGTRYPVNRDVIRDRVEQLLTHRRVKGKVSVSVSIVGNRKMKQINKQYRQKDYATDVLSFPTYDPTQPMDEGGFAHAEELGLALGDIVVSYPIAVKYAAEKRRYLDDIIGDLVEHGLLHLLGIHHD